MPAAPETSAAQPLYSARAIRIFSALFSAVAGGFLLAQNFRDVGRPDAARKALWGSIAYTIVVLVLVSFLPERVGNGGGLGLGVGLAGGMGLTAYSDKIILNKEEFPAKGILKPLLICLVVFIPIVALVVYAAFNA